MKTLQTQTFSQTNQDPFKSFLSLKTKFPKAFFFQVMGTQGPKLSLIGLLPFEIIKSLGPKIVVQRENEILELDQDILSYLSMVLTQEYKKTKFPYEHGGAFGCLGHEIITLIEPKLKNSGYLKDFPMEAEIFLTKDLVIFEHEKKVIHFVTQDLTIELDDLMADSEPLTMAPSHSVDFKTLKAHLGHETFLSGVAKIKEHISLGNIFQAVLSERFERTVISSPVAIFQEVRRLGKSAYSFYFDFEASSFFGSSPESFLMIEENAMTTHPIAGTRPRGTNVEHDLEMEKELKVCSKEAAEHLMLVDLARNDLGRVSQKGTVKVSVFRTLLKLPSVMHLVSEVTGLKKIETNAVEAFKACFPAGTLSGAPKVRALEILSEVETRSRGFYGGAVVAFDFGGNLESCIAIRAIEVKNTTAILRAGAGIVADSDPESEYLEIQHKLKGMMMAINNSEASV
jgi:anthranilate synthase component 1